jgi:predicted site-specific integrase-resolvase
MKRPAQKLISHKQLAVMLGVTTVRVRTWIVSGYLKPHSQIAKTYFFRIEDVNSFVSRGTWFKAD